jgi:hypothetical protein
MFSKRGNTIKLFELVGAPAGSSYKFTLIFYHRAHGRTTAMTIFQIHEDEFAALDAFLEWIGESVPTAD